MHPSPSTAFLVTCEHGGNRVPLAWRELFAPFAELLETHRGWDPGALPLARVIARRVHAPLIAATTTRLLVDLNRSAHNPRVFSVVTRPLPRAVREELLATYHAPHHAEVTEAVEGLLSSHRRVVHLGIHSFTPVFDGKERRIDVALLYDPARQLERSFCDRWLAALGSIAPALRLRRNAPYTGTADGLTTILRRRFPASRYLGIELEVNQGLAASDRVALRAVVESLPCVKAAGASTRRSRTGRGIGELA